MLSYLKKKPQKTVAISITKVFLQDLYKNQKHLTCILK